MEQQLSDGARARAPQDRNGVQNLTWKRRSVYTFQLFNRVDLLVDLSRKHVDNFIVDDDQLGDQRDICVSMVIMTELSNAIFLNREQRKSE